MIHRSPTHTPPEVAGLRSDYNFNRVAVATTSPSMEQARKICTLTQTNHTQPTVVRYGLRKTLVSKGHKAIISKEGMKENSSEQAQKENITIAIAIECSSMHVFFINY